jgi:hypothetical protein
MARHPRYGHPLRGPSGLHKAAFWKVLASCYAKAPLGVAHRWRALTGFQNRPYVKWPSLGSGRVSRQRLPGRFAP